MNARLPILLLLLLMTTAGAAVLWRNDAWRMDFQSARAKVAGTQGRGDEHKAGSTPSVPAAETADRLEVHFTNVDGLEIRPPAAQPLLQTAAATPAAPQSITDLSLVRINLTPQPARRARFAIDGAYRIQAVESGKVVGRGSRLEPAEVRTTPTGIRIGSREFTLAQLEIVADNSPAIWIDESQYRGSVRLYRRSANSFLIVNHLPLGEYLAGVVDSEMPLAFPHSARQAQAIVSRTYALYQMSRGHPQFDLFATSRSQLYRGFQYRDSSDRLLAGESPNSRQVVRETSGQICTERGRIFCTYFSATCGGRTTPGNQVFADAAPPLKSVACHWCREATYYRWNRETSKPEASLRLGEYFARRKEPFGTLRSITPAPPQQSGEAPAFAVSDGRYSYRVPAADLRYHLASTPLPSPHFSIQEKRDRFVFTGRGHGHGVGLCQWGARGMALAGFNASQIVRHYYPGAQVVVIRGNATARE